MKKTKYGIWNGYNYIRTDEGIDFTSEDKKAVEFLVEMASSFGSFGWTVQEYEPNKGPSKAERELGK